MIAALYVQANGSYFRLPAVDPWCETRDARGYAGPFPVVAHPPCQRWGKMYFGQPLTVKRTGLRKKLGDDGGCFKAALAAVRQWGGILEHPHGSHAWKYFGLTEPPRAGGWIKADDKDGWTCCVEQGRYGHYARKPTWLYAVGCDLPELEWGESEARYDPAVVERMGLKRAKRLGEVGARGGGTGSADLDRADGDPSRRRKWCGAMSYDCYCDYDPPEWMSQYTIKAARKQHQCYECRAPIFKGESYEYTSGKWNGGVDAYHTCARCVELRQWATISVPCFCWGFGNLHNDVHEMVREVVRDCPPGFFMEFGRRMVKIRNEARTRRAVLSQE